MSAAEHLGGYTGNRRATGRGNGGCEAAVEKCSLLFIVSTCQYLLALKFLSLIILGPFSFGFNLYFFFHYHLLGLILHQIELICPCTRWWKWLSSSWPLRVSSFEVLSAKMIIRTLTE